MLLGIVSDTHSVWENIDKAITKMQQLQVGRIYHCGDWTEPEVMQKFAQTGIAIRGVMGNCDLNYLDYQIRGKTDVKISDRLLEDRQQNKKIAVYHGHDQNFLQKIIDSGRYDLVFCGHTHWAQIEQHNQTIVINPGSVMGYYGRPVRKKIQPSVAVYNLNNNQGKIIKI
ncbi:MAG: YfcE family phosphodiesterase [Candidatus Moranbacteria bacterium]|nr:YfcE family phosphodiesterase [Candidatus Moranbacteria bacterium]